MKQYNTFGKHKAQTKRVSAEVKTYCVPPPVWFIMCHFTALMFSHTLHILTYFSDLFQFSMFRLY